MTTHLDEAHKELRFFFDERAIAALDTYMRAILADSRPPIEPAPAGGAPSDEELERIERELMVAFANNAYKPGFFTTDFPKIRRRALYEAGERAERERNKAEDSQRIQDDVRGLIAERVMFAFHIYPNYRVDSRGPAGCLIDILRAVRPDIADAFADDGEASRVYERFFEAESGEAAPPPPAPAEKCPSCEADRIESLSDDEILAEATAEGIDVNREAERTKAVLLAALEARRHPIARGLASVENEAAAWPEWKRRAADSEESLAIPQAEKCPEPLPVSSDAWRCSCCGELMDNTLPDGSWRWNGTAFEHWHGQGGYFVARNFGTGTAETGATGQGADVAAPDEASVIRMIRRGIDYWCRDHHDSYHVPDGALKAAARRVMKLYEARGEYSDEELRRELNGEGGR